MTKTDAKYHEMAESLGFTTEKALYETEYLINKKSTSDISKIINISQNTTRWRIKRSGINLRSRGGANHIKKMSSVKMCKRCGIRPIPDNPYYTRLCEYCHKVKPFEYERSFEGCL